MLRTTFSGLAVLAFCTIAGCSTDDAGTQPDTTVTTKPANMSFDINGQQWSPEQQPESRSSNGRVTITTSRYTSAGQETFSIILHDSLDIGRHTIGGPSSDAVATASYTVTADPTNPATTLVLHFGGGTVDITNRTETSISGRFDAFFVGTYSRRITDGTFLIRH